MATSTTRRLVSIDVAAEYLAVNPRTVRRLIADGALPGYRLNRLVRVDMADVVNMPARMPTADGAS